MTTTRRQFLKASFFPVATALSGVSLASPVKTPEKWDHECDMLIIGAGGGGLAGAIIARTEGLETIVLEKTTFPGGSTLICGGAWSVCGTDMQKERNIHDSPERFLEDMLKTGQHRNDPELVKAMIASSQEMFEFARSKIKVSFSDVTAASGMSLPRAHRFVPSDLIKLYFEYAKKVGAQFLFRTKAERLFWDAENERIIGVRATNAEGKAITIHAKKGVLIASGGFSRNPALLQKYNPLMASVDAEGGIGNTGDGMLMAQAYGADTLDMQYIKATFGYRPDPKKYGPDTLHGYYAGAILVNDAGKRFVDESISYKLLSDAALQQPEAKVFEFFDEALRVEMRDASPKYKRLLSPMDGNGETDFCFRGNTIEEVAQKAGIDPKTLKETVERYNQFAENGRDDDFGRTSLTSGYGKLVKFETGPFFLYAARPRLIATYCGIRIDPKARVIDVFGEPIPNLYACGEVVGGVHGAAYMTGTAVAKAMAFGRIAALEIARS